MNRKISIGGERGGFFMVEMLIGSQVRVSVAQKEKQSPAGY